VLGRCRDLAMAVVMMMVMVTVTVLVMVLVLVTAMVRVMGWVVVVVVVAVVVVAVVVVMVAMVLVAAVVVVAAADPLQQSDIHGFKPCKLEWLAPTRAFETMMYSGKTASMARAVPTVMYGRAEVLASSSCAAVVFSVTETLQSVMDVYCPAPVSDVVAVPHHVSAGSVLSLRVQAVALHIYGVDALHVLTDPTIIRQRGTCRQGPTCMPRPTTTDI
jgi:hypothetical protein